MLDGVIAVVHMGTVAGGLGARDRGGAGGWYVHGHLSGSAGGVSGVRWGCLPMSGSPARNLDTLSAVLGRFSR